MDISTGPYNQGCPFPAEIITDGVWLYSCSCLSLRDVQGMMLDRGVQVLHEGIRLWTLEFGGECAERMRHGGHPYGDTWHLDEVFCKINGQWVCR